jgi:flagellar biosynthetic protein FlhB
VVSLAEANGQEKTEQPTSKRRRDARKKGNVFQSKDIVTVVMLFGVFYMTKLLLPLIYETLRSYMEFFFSAISQDAPFEEAPQIYVYSMVSLLKCALPLLAVSMALGILGHGIQTRFLFTMESVKPKFSKLNPISGIKNMFSLKKVVDLVKNLIKIAILLALLYNLVISDLSPIARMIDTPIFRSATQMLSMVFELVKKVCIAFAVVAFFDFLYQRWDYENNLKMTKQEVKEEYKMTEGNPEIKGRIRRIQRQMAMSRMMQSVPEADVVVRNPTHFAVALKYDPEKHGAPVVLAMGQDHLAFRIIKVAEEHGVSVLEDRPLARALYASCEVGREIPPDFYGAVAELLVYIYRLNHRDEMLQ